MQSVKGKHVRPLDAAALVGWAARYHDVTIDLGTGDGHFVRHLARTCPAAAVIGVDTCRANLQRSSGTAPENARFVVGDALALPGDLQRLASRLTVNFPWGSLLRGLLDDRGEFLAGLHALGRPGTAIEVRVNAGALAETGWSLEVGTERIAAALRRTGLAVGRPSVLGPAQLRAYPTTWAKRLAFGRDPRALQIVAVLA